MFTEDLILFANAPPYAASFAWQGTYVYMGADPVNMVDPNGGFVGETGEEYNNRTSPNRPWNASYFSRQSQYNMPQGGGGSYSSRVDDYGHEYRVFTRGGKVLFGVNRTTRQTLSAGDLAAIYWPTRIELAERAKAQAAFAFGIGRYEVVHKGTTEDGGGLVIVGGTMSGFQLQMLMSVGHNVSFDLSDWSWENISFSWDAKNSILDGINISKHASTAAVLIGHLSAVNVMLGRRDKDLVIIGNPGTNDNRHKSGTYPHHSTHIILWDYTAAVVNSTDAALGAKIIRSGPPIMTLSHELGHVYDYLENPGLNQSHHHGYAIAWENEIYRSYWGGTRGIEFRDETLGNVEWQQYETVSCVWCVPMY